MSSSDSRPLPIQLNLNVRGLRQSATLEINERSNALRAQGRAVFKLGLGQSPFPVAEPVVAALQANAHQKDYLPVRGLPALRQAVADYYRRRRGFHITGEDVLIGPGSKELMFLLQLVYYGDLVIPTPSWVSYAPQAHIVGRHVRWLKTRKEDGWKLTPEELSTLCEDDPDRPRIVILNYPSNPTGLTYSRDELAAIAEVARRHRIIVVSDEIYGEMQYDGAHVSIASEYPEGTIISSGLSKWCGAGGWRLGTFAFPRDLRWLLDAMANVASETFTSTSAPIQYAAVVAFEGSAEIERYLAGSRRVLDALGTHCSQRLRAAGADVHDPQGGFYIFPDFSPLRAMLEAREIRTSRRLASQLLEDTGVAVLPGEEFGRPSEELTLRLAFVDFDGGRALTAAENEPHDRPLSPEFLQNYCGGVVEAVDRIASWLA